MNIKIVRYRKKTDTVDGHLYIEGMHICDCAENAKTAIKTGTYHVVITKCHQHARKMPVILLNDVVSKSSKVSGSSSLKPIETAEGMKLLETKCSHCERQECVSNNSNMPRFCPQICQGNGVYNRTDGAIIVGTYLAPGCLTHPKEAFETIYDRLRKSAERGHEITLEIVEAYPKPITHDLTPYQMGQKALAQMGGNSLTL